MPDENVKPFLHGSLKGLSDNAAIFPKPPVELAAYQAAIEAYEAAIPAALDGSKTAAAQKNKLRDAAIRMYIELAHYVEANFNDDPATFLLSGFQPVSSVKAPPQPLEQPAIASVVQGSRYRSTEDQDPRGPESAELHVALRRRCERRRIACIVEGANHHQHEARDTRWPDARNRLYISGPGV